MEKKLVPELRFPWFGGEWEENKLGELGIFGKRYSYSRDDEGIGMYHHIHYGDIHSKFSGSISEKSDIPSIIMDKEHELISYGDIIIADASEDYKDLGKTVVIKDISNRKIIAGSHTFKFTPNDTLDPVFYMNYSKTNSYKRFVRINGTGVSVLGLSKTNLTNMKFNVPSIEEQQKIANFFTLIDEKIEKQEEKVINLEEYKKGMIQKIFSQEVRFKDENGEDYPEWEEKRLAKIVDRITTRNSNNESNHVLTISAEMGLIDQEEYFTKRVASKNLNNYYLISKNDFAYNKSYSKGYPYGTIKKLNRYEKGVLSSLYICFRAKANNHMYLEHYFETTEWHKEIYKIAVEGARNHGLLNIGLTEFFNIKIKIPYIKEQTKISRFLSSLDSKIEKETEKLDSLKDLKKGLMQKIFI